MENTENTDFCGIDTEFCGVARYYVFFSGKEPILVREGFEINGVKHGVHKRYYLDGSYKTKTYVNDVLHGEYKIYDSNGKLTRIIIFINGKQKQLATYREEFGRFIFGSVY